MKPFLFAAAMATALVSLCASFSSGKEAPLPAPSEKAAPVIAAPASERWIQNFQNAHYYWFIANGDVYDGWYTIGQEIGRMETLTGLFCDTDPSGDLVSRGYTLPIVPHLVWPSAFVFSH